MKAKRTTIVYIPKATVPAEELGGVLSRNRASLIQRGITSAEIEYGQLNITGFFDEEFPVQIEGVESCGLNAYSDDRLLDGMTVESVTVSYSDALIPLPSKRDMNEHGTEFRNGECRHHVESEPGKFITPIVTSLPSRETVSIFLKIEGEGYDERDPYRRALLNVMWEVERKIIATRKALQLIKAFRTTPPNEGFVERAIRELFVAIGRF
jgi:hypothetical protein